MQRGGNGDSERQFIEDVTELPQSARLIDFASVNEAFESATIDTGRGENDQVRCTTVRIGSRAVGYGLLLWNVR